MNASPSPDTWRTSYARRLTRYEAKRDAARDELAAVDPGDELARRRAIAQLDELYVGAAPIRNLDPEIRRLRRAERRGAVHRSADEPEVAS